MSKFLLGLNADQALRRRRLEPRLERFIGVIYRPETELMSHYSEASLPRQVDAYIWFDETTAVTPLAPSTTPGATRNVSIRPVNSPLTKRLGAPLLRQSPNQNVDAGFLSPASPHLRRPK
jgi:hypothetical protein